MAIGKEVNIQDMSALEIEQLLASVPYNEEDNLCIKGNLDIAVVMKVRGLDSEDQISLVNNTWMVNMSLCTENDGVSEQYFIKDIANKLYRIEQQYK